MYNILIRGLKYTRTTAPLHKGNLRTFTSALVFELNKIQKTKNGSEIMLEYDEYRLQLQGMEDNITELRDSL